ncbi:MAG: hypothetical protein CMH98_19000 [Oceanospirillaceae bacterium]|nr:hypothetical protein [Oceanospirillaceae bacterium]
MSDVQNGGFTAISEEKLVPVKGEVGRSVNKAVRLAESQVGKAMACMRGGLFGGPKTPELEETESFKQLSEILEALSKLGDLTEPDTTTRL